MLYNSLHRPVVPGHVQEDNRFNSVNWLYRYWNSIWFSELLSSLACDLELLKATKSAWDFLGLIFGPDIFLGFAGSPREFFGS